MREKNTVFDFLSQIMVIWAISVLSLCLFCVLFGEGARDKSTIFALGSQGISVTILLQFLGLAVIIETLRVLFFTDIVLKNWGIVVRVAGMFGSVVLVIGLFAGVFQWFPINQVMPWVMFFVCFLVCGSGSVIVSVLKEKSDNRKMQEALARMKGEEESE